MSYSTTAPSEFDGKKPPVDEISPKPKFQMTFALEVPFYLAHLHDCGEILANRHIRKIGHFRKICHFRGPLLLTHLRESEHWRNSQNLPFSLVDSCKYYFVKFREISSNLSYSPISPFTSNSLFSSFPFHSAHMHDI